MKTQLQRRSANGGFALMMVVLFMAIGLMTLGGALSWVSSNSLQVQRNNEYFRAVAAAEAATEKVITHVQRDYLSQGESLVFANLSQYTGMVPTTNENPGWADFEFRSAQGNANQTYVVRPPGQVTNWVELESKYKGLRGVGSTYRIISNTRSLVTGSQAGIMQEVQVTTIPLFQFAIFYNMDMEVNPGANMNIRGRVHSNADMYTAPPSPLTYHEDVTAVKNIYLIRKPGDPNGNGGANSNNVTFVGKWDSKAASMTLPIATNNTPEAVYGVLEIPPSGEDPNSPVGKDRYYNKAEMILLVSDAGVSVSGPAGSGITIPASQWQTFVQTNVSWRDKREGQNVQAVQIDVAKLRQWSQTNSTLRSTVGDVNIVYVKDGRSTSTAVMTTNYTYSTNYTFVTNTVPAVSVDYPGAGTYVGVVSTTGISTNSTSRPTSPPAYNITTNCASTTTTGAKNASLPNNYCPGSEFYNNSTKRWTYRLIAGYSYTTPAYAYDKVTSVTTITQVTTNTYYTTNMVAYAQSGVRLVNGQQLPNGGLTVATPNPLYIQGDYNVTTNGVNYSRGSTNTAYTAPASVVADAITVLSTNWVDGNSAWPLANRTAGPTTVNAAFMGGIVPTGGGYYSGGVENFPRFLENWSSKVFTYNGSMIVMFPSRVATQPWGQSDVYNPPTRSWTFDMNFRDATKLPPGTPQILKVFRGTWASVRPGDTQPSL